MSFRILRSLCKSNCCTRRLSTIPNKSTTLKKFNFPVQKHSFKYINENLDKYINKKQSKITLNGHIHKKSRIRPTLSFGFIRDKDGNVIQFVVNENSQNNVLETLKKLTVEESISITGHIQQKVLTDGESAKWELVVEDLQVLNESNIDAPRLDKLKHSNPEELPPQFRYLQLRTSFFQNALKVRSKISQLVRNLLIDKYDFTEIETPLLFKSTPEGAREFLVPTRSSNQFYALPQSPQQYKQILMSSGFTKYFQIAKCFRDEDLRSDRQPEFTQIDLEMSFVNSSKQVMTVVEDIILNIWEKIKVKPMYALNEKNYLEKITSNEDRLKFKTLTYKEALEKYGIDKPDLRYNLEFINLNKYFTAMENENFPIVEICVLKRAFIPGIAKRTKIPPCLGNKLEYKRRRPYIFTIDNETDKTSWIDLLIKKNFMKQNENSKRSTLLKELNLQPGDIIGVSTRSELPYENPTPLGKFRQLAIKNYPNNSQRPIQEDGEMTWFYPVENVTVGSWVVDFPLFDPVEIKEDDETMKPYPTYDFNKFESTHHPFTMCKSEDYGYLESDPLKVRGEHYDLVINGVEVGGGSRRIHDPTLQQYIFENILKISNWELKFGHLIKALSMGCPPHAGLALGFDRLCAMVIGSSSIKDVIAFPKNQSGVDKVVDSPTPVSKDTLKEYFIEVNEEK
ncbi:MSD1 [Candida pseudojiufengensis]|uniref:MSD1 n=1 Tax=Candida pseudojiufengensis TaxID=497109 RepID=UPI002224271A|nr:MSD1 [Candida pseudojiufengensis]KAI5960365.1 MSD1 [Candida pseudojiufengensis]